MTKLNELQKRIEKLENQSSDWFGCCLEYKGACYDITTLKKLNTPKEKPAPYTLNKGDKLYMTVGWPKTYEELEQEFYSFHHPNFKSVSKEVL